MPTIELALPGEAKTTVIPFAEVYRVTVERDDGFACSDIEARTAISMLCIHSLSEKKSKNKKRKAPPKNES